MHCKLFYAFCNESFLSQAVRRVVLWIYCTLTIAPIREAVRMHLYFAIRCIYMLADASWVLFALGSPY